MSSKHWKCTKNVYIWPFLLDFVTRRFLYHITLQTCVGFLLASCLLPSLKLGWAEGRIFSFPHHSIMEIEMKERPIQGYRNEPPSKGLLKQPTSLCQTSLLSSKIPTNDQKNCCFQGEPRVKGHRKACNVTPQGTIFADQHRGNALGFSHIHFYAGYPSGSLKIHWGKVPKEGNI